MGGHNGATVVCTNTLLGFLSFRTVEDFRVLRLQMVFYLVGEQNYSSEVM